MTFLVKHRTSGQYSEPPVSGPFGSRGAAESFVVALAHSGTCYEATIITEDERAAELGPKTVSLNTHLTLTELMKLDSETLNKLFEKLVNLQKALLKQHAAWEVYSRLQKDGTHPKAVVNKATDAYTIARREHDDLVEDYTRFTMPLSKVVPIR